MTRLFDFSSGSFASVFGVEVYGDHSDTWWHKAFIKPIFRVGNRVSDGVWWLRYRIDPRHRYHLIDTHLGPNYHDVDELMLHGMFSLLRRYVEDEMGGAADIVAFNEELLARPDANEPEGMSAAQAGRQGEAVALYQWWMVYRPAMVLLRDKLMLVGFGGQCWDSVPVEGNAHLSELVFRPVGDEISAVRKEVYALEDKIDREDQEMLHRLIEIRRSLWT